MLATKVDYYQQNTAIPRILLLNADWFRALYTITWVLCNKIQCLGLQVAERTVGVIQPIVRKEGESGREEEKWDI